MNRRTPQLVARLLTCPDLSWRTRLSLIVAKAARGVGVKRDLEVRLCQCSVWLGRDTFAIDWNVFIEIFLDHAYGLIDYAGADVLDAGAHKGYFAAFALENGASSVTSLEPEPYNFRHLARAAAGNDAWRVRRQAVAGKAGTRSLRLGLAYSHSLVLETGSEDAIEVEAVTLAELLGASSGGRLIAKLDIEGAECEALSATPAEKLSGLDALVVETHADAPCGRDDVVTVAEATGLCLVTSPCRPTLLTFVRPPPSAGPGIHARQARPVAAAPLW